MNNPSDDHSELDFYISANRESAAAQEVDQVLREAGYAVYLPARNNGEAEADHIAANQAEAIVLILANDSEQTQIDLDDLLNILSVSDAERRVIIFQFDECEIASLLDRNFITNLVGLNSADRAARILASAAQSPQNKLPTQAARKERHGRRQDNRTDGPSAWEATAQDESQPYADCAAAFEDDSHQEVRAPSTDGEAELRAPPVRRLGRIFPAPPISSSPMLRAAAPDVVSSPWLHEAARTAREATTYSDTEREEVRLQTPEKRDIIEFGVGHPTSVTIGVAFIVDVLIYRQDARERVAELAAELRAENDRFGFAGANEVVRGTKLNVTLELPWPTEPKIQSVYWSGLTANISFRVSPTNLPHAPIYGVCKIAVNGLTIGQVFFRLEANPSGVADERRFSAARAIKTAFASYTSKDRRRVLARVQGIEKLGVKVFIDTHGLRSNDQYKTRIFQAIDSADIFYLFWSRHAQHSNWVDQEWRYGFKQKGLGFIDPVPLVDPRKAPPPAELAEHKHFNDWTFIYSEYEKSLSTWTRIRSWLAD
jgi:TIR domain